jgi:3-oxoacyl-[acyl-carrier-protein] synthase-3
MQLAATMIDAGRIAYALVVDGEGARHTHEVTLARLARPDATRDDVLSQFATLTLGSGAAAMVLGLAEAHPEGHRLVGGVMRAETEHHELCIGDLESMQTDARGLLDAGMALSRATWEDAKAHFDWADMDRYIAHQVSQVHTAAMCRTLRIDSDRVPRSFPLRGNMGPASIPFTLATQVDSLQTGDRVLLMGVGSGLNACCTELAW